MSKPLAVLISDIHFNIKTLSVADAALRMAVAKANELGVKLVIAGDLHDTKANLRAECVTAIRDTLNEAQTPPVVLVGNHDKINEKSADNALSFIDDAVSVVSYATCVAFGPEFKRIHLLPYYHDTEVLKAVLSGIPKGSTVIMHQGCSGSNSGEYIQDKSALPKEYFADFRVISGHYHTRQTIRTSDTPSSDYVGTFDYIGNPYTLNYAEVSDPPKGFQILNDDGSLTFFPTNLRKHVTINLTDSLTVLGSSGLPLPGDIVQVKIKGPSDRLATINRSEVADAIGFTGDFRLELCPTATLAPTVESTDIMPAHVVLDGLIDSMVDTDETRKTRLKHLWKFIMAGMV